MSGTTARTLRVLVVGAGVAGLTPAAALERRCVAATVAERTADGGRGYVPGLHPIASHVLCSLDGTDQDLLRAAVPVDRLRLLDGADGTGSTVRTPARPAREVGGVDTGCGGRVGFVDAASDPTAARPR